MASSLQFLLLFSFIPLITSSFPHIPRSQNALILSLNKDPSTHQYVTDLYMGTPMASTKLVVDLKGPFPWIDCTSRHVSSSHRTIPSRSLHCSRAKAHGYGFDYGSGRESCSLDIVNTITRVAALGNLAKDIMAVRYVDRYNQSNPITAVDSFLLFSCAPPLLLNGLPSGVKGMLGLGRGRISLPSQLTNRKLVVCLSSNNGFVISGDWIPLLPPVVSNSLMYTPLISKPEDDALDQDYYIKVKSIKINGKKLTLDTSKLSGDEKRENEGTTFLINESVRTSLSTIIPYTTMESTIYETFTRAYIKMAIAMNMTRVASMAPFGVCFSSDGIEKTLVGPAVPTIDLVLQSEMVRWRLYGRNSMVEVSDEVMCLGFVDGGLSPKGASMVIGGYQLEDNLLEFNLATSMLGFSSSLLMKETSCSHFKLHSIPSDSL